MRAYNSTIKIKEKICKRCGKKTVIFSHGRCQQCSKIESANKHSAKDVDNDDTLKELVEVLDTVFSKFIRLKYADEKGMVECFTCDTRLHYTLMQAGHFVGRSSMFLRWDDRNVRPQCEHCNCHLHGNISEFTTRLEAERPGIVEILSIEKNTVQKWSKDELIDLITQYRFAIKHKNFH